MESQYTDRYLNQTNAGRLITPGTFLAYNLEGKARAWASRYEGALIRSIVKRGAVQVPSVGGRTAYVLPKESK